MPPPRSTPIRSILITGATSGIGRALALDYAAPGVFLALTGRDSARLDDIARAVRQQGAEVSPARLDVTDRAAMEAFIRSCDRTRPLDLVIANAGISGGTLGPESDETARALFATNVEGVFNTIGPAIAMMKARRRGQIALMASLAGYRGLPGAPAYCASKAAVKAYGEGLRVELASQGIGVSVICPGFVKSRITDANRFPMPGLMDGARAAAIIRRGLAANRARISFPKRLAFAAWLIAALPPAWSDRLLARLPRNKDRNA